MKSYLVPALTLGLLAGGLQAEDKPDFNDPKAKASYAIGVNIGTRFKAQDMDVDLKAFAAGIGDAMTGKPLLDETNIMETLTKYSADMTAKALTKNKDFLDANGKKEGVKTTTSGLQYKVIKSGTGATPTKTDTVKVHYHGTLIDGKVFDSSVQRGEPVTFPVGGVIPGWTEALQLMKVGDKWTLYIPSNLAYGERPPPGSGIQPNSTLIFDVELLGIEKPEADKPAK